MLLNIILQAWVIGSITLLINKQDEHTGHYRDVLHTLDDYAKAHNFDLLFYQRLKTQLKLDFDNREISDEHVLKDFPYSVRRKVLRRLYLPSLFETSLLRGVRQQYVDAFLAACKVEIFSPGEELIAKGTVAADLYLVVGGVVGLSTRDKVVSGNQEDWESERTDSVHGGNSSGWTTNTISSGEFINAVGFFTESPQMEHVRTISVCKILTLSRSSYRTLCQDFPESTSTVLQNLLKKVESMQVEKPDAFKPADGRTVRFEGNQPDESQQTQRQIQLQAAETTVKDMIQMHVNKLKDDRTTRFLFAASRGDGPTITIMLGHGLDPNAADYDKRTGLMVAAMNGQVDVCKQLLEYNANPNLVDMHGPSALLEAATHGHEEVMKVLLEHKAELCLSEAQAASTLCQAVFDGDVVRLRHLIQAGISVNAGDYDKRTAVHIAAAEGNVAALRIMVEQGKADLNVRDRWNNSVRDEAVRANSGQVMEYLEAALPSAS
jgi:ankyrin repeat protein